MFYYHDKVHVSDNTSIAEILDLVTFFQQSGRAEYHFPTTIEILFEAEDLWELRGVVDINASDSNLFLADKEKISTTEPLMGH